MPAALPPLLPMPPSLTSSGLLALVSTKGTSEEVLLAAGEALAAVCGDVGGWLPADLLWTNFEAISDAVDAAQPLAAAAAAAAAAGASGPMDVDGQAAASADTTTSSSVSSVSHPAVQRFLLSEVAGTLCVSPKEDVRCGGCVVLVSLLQLCSASAVFGAELPRLQATFTGLLGDTNELTQVCQGTVVLLRHCCQETRRPLCSLAHGSTTGPGCTRRLSRVQPWRRGAAAAAAVPAAGRAAGRRQQHRCGWRQAGS
jgi:hypothetical protein